jgi:hypothetical protein
MSAVPVWLLTAGVLAVVPESPHFLVDRGRDDEARRVLHRLLERRVSEVAGPELVEATVSAVSVVEGESSGPSGARTGTATMAARAGGDVSAAARDGGSATGADVALSGRSALLELCATSRVTRITMVETYLFITVAMSYYGISFNAQNLSDNVYLDFFLVSLPLFVVRVACPRLLTPRTRARRDPFDRARPEPIATHVSSSPLPTVA